MVQLQPRTVNSKKSPSLDSRLPSVLALAVIGVCGAAVAAVLHRALDVPLGRPAVGALAGLLFGGVLGAFIGRVRADKIFYAVSFGLICAVFTWAATSLGVQ